MEFLFKSILVSYFILFIGIALLYRSYVLYKKTGINALTQVPEERTLKILAIVFKIQLATAISLIVDDIYTFDFFSANRFEWIPHLAAGSLGSLLLVLCFMIIITAQQQMRTSWRIEIDRSDHQAPLITSGLFRYSRNPIFLALRLSYLALFLIIPCPASLMVLIAGDITFQWQVQKEEAYLNQLYGEQYTDYCSRVARWL